MATAPTEALGGLPGRELTNTAVCGRHGQDINAAPIVTAGPHGYQNRRNHRGPGTLLTRSGAEATASRRKRHGSLDSRALRRGALSKDPA
jgi:hypothetical protein